ncbi:FAD-dependent oxidoreductase [Micromonospora sp. DT201]|uniref:FAD-dependent oxidoreductase n=1 Tax=Micromonospora sp. DT201 TaxID=3393442 RepID=UPI003CF83BEC
MRSTPLRVLIVGGGIGGLCLAQGLRRQNVDVTVYERDRAPDARLQGYRINIEAAGSAALAECLPTNLWRELTDTAGDPGPGMGVYDERLRLMVRIGPETHDAVAAGEHAVSRVALRQLLLTDLDDMIRFDKEFIGYEQHRGGTVTARFADGSSATADLLVGADGARSRVRRQLLPNAGEQPITAIGVGGKLPLTPRTEAWLPTPITTRKNMFLPRQDFLFTSAFRSRRPSDTDADYVMWAYVADRNALPAATAALTGKPLRDLVAARMTDWHPDLRRMVMESAPESTQQFAFAASAPVTPWPTGNVTLLGDAIHHMPPVGGLGGNAALHDARLLCHALTEISEDRTQLRPALASYEKQMLQHGFAAVAESMRNLKVATQRREARTAVRGFFRLCGAMPPLRRAVFGE